MAYTVLTMARLKLGELDLQEATASVAISYTADAVEFGTMGDRNVKRFAGGPTDWAVELELVVDESVFGQSLFDMVGNIVEFEVTPGDGVVSASNPKYSGLVFISSYTPLGSGEWGDVITASISAVAAGSLTRSIS
jgi:hypothetical protein